MAWLSHDELISLWYIGGLFNISFIKMPADIEMAFSCIQRFEQNKVSTFIDTKRSKLTHESYK